MSEVELPICGACGKQLEPLELRLSKFLEGHSHLVEKMKEHGCDLLETEGPQEYGCRCSVAYMTLEQYEDYWKEEKILREELGFVLHVSFGDNDFAAQVEAACKDLYQNMSRGHVNSEGIKNGLEYVEKVGMENLRKYVVMTAFGYYIADKMRHWLLSAKRGRDEDPYELKQYEDTLEYLDKNITVKKLDDYEKQWENSEECYLDFTHREVHLQ